MLNVVLVSCDEFLTEIPHGDLTEANAFTSIKDAEALIVSCYDGIQKGHEEYYMWYYMIFSDCLSDNAYSGGDDVDNGGDDGGGDGDGDGAGGGGDVD